MFYAQTNIQLYNQLRQDGYFESDILRIHDAYGLIMVLFKGRFRPSGKTFIDHLVGTASILASLRCPIELVVAGLVHAAYAEGDFGTEDTGISDEKRNRVRQVLGDDAEKYIYRYTIFLWRSKKLPEMHAAMKTMEKPDRDVLLMRVANYLEDLLDCGILYSHAADSRKKSMERYNDLLMDIANELGFPTLAAELEQAYKVIINTDIPSNLRNETGIGRLRKVPE